MKKNKYYVKTTGYNYNHEQVPMRLGYYTDEITNGNGRIKWIHDHERLAEVFEFDSLEQALEKLQAFMSADLYGAELMTVDTGDDYNYNVVKRYPNSRILHETSMVLKMILVSAE